ncbi:hypothetical protein GCM10009834_39330 [Streptomonospora arabica]
MADPAASPAGGIGEGAPQLPSREGLRRCGPPAANCKDAASPRTRSSRPTVTRTFAPYVVAASIPAPSDAHEAMRRHRPPHEAEPVLRPMCRSTRLSRCRHRTTMTWVISRFVQRVGEDC